MSLSKEDLQAVQERFWKKVYKARVRNACWQWLGATDPLGYGHVRLPDRSFAHAARLAYEWEKGPIPDGFFLSPVVCKNTGCVRPSHHKPMTPHDVWKNGNSLPARNARKTHCPYGHPYKGKNLLVSTGQRKCRICMRKGQERFYASFKKVPKKPKPTREQLAKDMEHLAWAEIGRHYGVTDNGARVWARKYGLL